MHDQGFCAHASARARHLRPAWVKLGIARQGQLLQRLDVVGERIIRAHRTLRDFPQDGEGVITLGGVEPPDYVQQVVNEAWATEPLIAVGTSGRRRFAAGRRGGIAA